MKLEEAQDIVKWRYDYPYSRYDMSDDVEDIQELMDGTYFSAKNLENELIGFFCFGLNAQINASNGIHFAQKHYTFNVIHKKNLSRYIMYKIPLRLQEVDRHLLVRFDFG
jgi:hypothetical protein